MNDLQVLLIKDILTKYQVVGITNLVDYVQTSNNFLFASKKALQIVSKALMDGESIFISKNINKNEVQPDDLEIEQIPPIERCRNIALSKIIKLINRNILSINIIEAMDFLNCYMKLLNAGIFITDSNREDKYFEIIEAAQENDEPEQLKENSTFEEEQNYIEKKRKYDIAQDNLSTLEKYLNAYDKLSKINFTNSLLNKIHTRILEATSEDQINKILINSQDEIKKYFYTPQIIQHEI